MNHSELYYCVVCYQLEPAHQAYQLFRTGFFRIVHPLGCCVQCREELRKGIPNQGGSHLQEEGGLLITVLREPKPNPGSSGLPAPLCLLA